MSLFVPDSLLLYLPLLTKRLQEQDSNMHCPLEMIVLEEEKNEPRIPGPKANIIRLAVGLLTKHRLEAKAIGNQSRELFPFPETPPS